MNAKVATRITINASPKEVFRYFEHLRLHYLWNPHQQKNSGPDRLKQGAQYRTTSLVFGVRVNAVNKVTKFNPGRELEIENNTGLVHYHARYNLSEKAGKTLLRLNLTLSADNQAFAFAKPVLKVMAQRELRSDLGALKLAVEEKLE